MLYRGLSDIYIMTPFEILKLFMEKLRDHSIKRPPEEQEARAFQELTYFQEHNIHYPLIKIPGRLRNISWYAEDELNLTIQVRDDLNFECRMLIGKAARIVFDKGMLHRGLFPITIFQQLKAENTFSLQLVFMVKLMPETWKVIEPLIK
jgi:hypothetical protein